MHVHDGKGRENHLPLGIGEINMKERISLAREHMCRKEYRGAETVGR